MAAIVIAVCGEENEAYGPFVDGDAASHWAHRNLKEPACDSWYWLDLVEPAGNAGRAEPLLDRG